MVPCGRAEMNSAFGVSSGLRFLGRGASNSQNLAACRCPVGPSVLSSRPAGGGGGQDMRRRGVRVGLVTERNRKEEERVGTGGRVVP